MKKKPMILLTPRVTYNNGNRLLYNFDGYYEAIRMAGGIACNVTIDYANLDEYAEIFDGLLITGGEDIDPSIYNEEKSKKTITTDRIIDDQEMKLIEVFIKAKKPILGICRGLQSLNVYFGGTLYQDVLDDLGLDLEYHEHYFRNESGIIDRAIAAHTVTIDKSSWLHNVYGDVAEVNSFHHQAIKDVAKNFNVVGISTDDNIVEALEDLDHKIIAVQWHPERMTKIREHEGIFIKYIELVKENM